MSSEITKDSDIDNANASTDKIAVVISSSREKPLDGKLKHTNNQETQGLIVAQC